MVDDTAVDYVTELHWYVNILYPYKLRILIPILDLSCFHVRLGICDER